MSQFRISGKDLGAVAMPDFCPRCFWIKRKAPDGLPYQIFPGIFSSIDSYTKHVVHSWFDRHPQSPPTWLSSLGDIVGYKDPPHFTKFNFVEPSTDVMVTGAPDAVFIRRDSSLMIADYKTAKFTQTQDTMFPVYVTQLNAYALIADTIGLGKVTKLALIYAEPVTDKAKANNDSIHSSEGFQMGFTAHILPVDLNTATILPLLKTTQEILSSPTPPAGSRGCKECGKLNGLINLIR